MILEKVNVSGCQDRMHPDAAKRFNVLRSVVATGAGFDFLSVCGDILRDPTFKSSKDGVANRSWHKTGRAFDYDQNNKNLVIVSEPINKKQFFRTFLICADQSGKQGVKKSLLDYRGHTVNKFVFDFTEAAENLGFKRIPAWSGYKEHYNRREFWHYQFDQGLTWDQAMQQLKTPAVQLAPGAGGLAQNGFDIPGKIKAPVIYGLNDRGEMVKKIQRRLNEFGFLPSAEIDGVYGAKTRAGVVAFQKSKKVPADGLVGSQTIKLLFPLGNA